ncbi:glucose-1-phosphate thymidylyltransferase [Chloroflexota bacterium]
MKALILAGGKGTRLRPLTHTTAKQLVPIAGKPILFYVLEQISEAGIKDAGIVVSPENELYIKEALADGSRWGIKPILITQHQPQGLAHAVKTARDYLGNSPFLLFLGDVLVQEKIRSMKEEFLAGDYSSMVAVKEVPDPRSFGVAEMNDACEVLRLVEKPQNPACNLVLAGVYFFRPDIHMAIDSIKPSWRNELEITDAIQKLVEMGKKVKGHILEGHWLDTGKKEDLLKANMAILEEMEGQEIAVAPCPASKITGAVRTGEGTVIENSIVKGPVFIGGNCRITASYIGPYTSISAGTVIARSSVENSVIMEDCYISMVESLNESILGKRARVTSGERKFKKTSLFVGDDSIVEI